MDYKNGTVMAIRYFYFIIGDSPLYMCTIIII